MAKKAKELKVSIKGTEYKCNFGFDFLNGINLLPNADTENDRFSLLIAKFYDGDPEGIRDLLYASLRIHDVTIAEVEEYLENEADVEKLHKDFFECLKSTPLLKVRMKNVLKWIERAEAQNNIDPEEMMTKLVEAAAHHQ